MSDDSSIQARLEALEQRARGNSEGLQTCRPVVVISALAFCALVSLNLWLIHAFLDLSTQHDQARLFWQICHSGSTPAERARAFLRLAALGNSEWRSARLTKLQLQGADLSGVDLHQADLSEANFSEAILTEAKLEGCYCQLTNFAGAQMTNAELSEAILLKADLSDAVLRAANLNAASLEQANVQRADLVLAQLADAQLLMVDLSEANLTGANLTGANLESAILKGANLSLTRLTDSKISDADFTDSNWWRARGLKPGQVQALQYKFPPTDQAPEARQNDYHLWQKGQRQAK